MIAIKKKFCLFLLINLVIWSLVPQLRLSLPMDTYEAIIWGKYSWLGTTKHPPFSGILSYCFYRLFGQTDGAIYLLSQLCVVAGLLYIYKLARQFFDETKAVLATMLQFGVIYYDFSSVEFNVNVISLALWPAAAYHFWRAYQQNTWKDWILFGFFSGINLLNKYVGALELVALAVFVLSDKKARGLLLNYKTYVSGLVCLGVVAPHIWWLYENDFEMLNYIAGRSAHKMSSAWGHLLYPLKFAGAQILFAAAAIISYLAFYFKAPKEKVVLSSEARKFLVCLGFVPAGIFLLLSLVRGAALKSMWGFPMLFLTGILLIGFLPVKFDAKKAGRLFVTMVVWSMLFAVAYAAQCLLTASERYRTDGRAFTEMMEQKWAEHRNGKPLKYTGGEVWYANLPAFYSKKTVHPMIFMSPKNNPWLDAEDFERSGALVMTADKGAYLKYMEQFAGKMTPPEHLEIVLTSFFGKKKTRVIYYGFYEGENADDRK